MSSWFLLRSAVNERLKAAAEDIFLIFERTIVKYEEEASTSKQEIERLRGLLQSKQKTDFCKEDSSIERRHSEQESSFIDCQADPQLRHIKQENHDCFGSQKNGEDEGEVHKFVDAYPPHSSGSWDKKEQPDTKSHLQPHTENSDGEEEFQNQQEAKTVFAVPLESQILVQNGREKERPATSSTSRTLTDDSQSSFITSREPIDFFQLNAVAAEHPCHLCDKYFTSNQHLLRHAFRMHSSDADVLCAVCGKTFESAGGLNGHLQLHKGSNCCHVCGKHYNSRTSLTEHMASHAGVKLHRCHVCGKECSRKGDLKIHMRIHTGEKPFCCSFCCKSFTHSGHLKKHMRSHTGERPHQCNVCGRAFLQSTHLKYHLGTHSQKY